ncbi:uncharacterized protein [Trachinotus anak]|uniref:uncharacterized protein n=1 Tax=Trachinotus anak TaxID=443729 RepID=UPI0039F1CB13
MYCLGSSSSLLSLQRRWKSLVNHLQDVHTNNDPIFPKCEHPDSATTDQSKCLQPGSKSLYKVEKALLNKRVLTDVGKLSPHHQTSSLEAFHSLILGFAPKNVVFPFLGMLCRLYLAAMHLNENTDCPQATSASGKPVFKRKFPKFKKGESVIKPVKTVPTYSYTQELMEVLFEQVFPDPAPYAGMMHSIPIPALLSSQYDRPSMEEAVAGYLSRFS